MSTSRRERHHRPPGRPLALLLEPTRESRFSGAANRTLHGEPRLLGRAGQGAFLVVLPGRSGAEISLPAERRATRDTMHAARPAPPGGGLPPSVTRDRIMREVWGAQWWGSTKTLDMHVSWLRRKLGDDATAPRYISTVRGVGFRFERG